MADIEEVAWAEWAAVGWAGRGGSYPRRTEESHPDGKKILEQMAKASGGRFFEVTKKETIDKIYADIDEELRNQYNVGYTPNKDETAVGYHTLHLAGKTKRRHSPSPRRLLPWTAN